MYIYPYSSYSKSVRGLARGLEAKIIKTKNSKFKGGQHKLVINWGCSHLPQEVNRCDVLNQPDSVDIASNKLNFFAFLMDSEAHIPRWTSNLDSARKWMINEGVSLVCRTVLNGHSGSGIVIAKTTDELVDCKLYTQYIPKKDEYRVHIGGCGNVIIDIQKKAKRADVPRNEANFQIRNHANGFIYMREGIDPPEKVLTYAKECVKMLGLNFGAVDVIWNERQKEAYVLEINTAPGLTGTTLDNYVKYFKKYENHR